MRLFTIGLLGAVLVLSWHWDLFAHAYLIQADPPPGAVLPHSPEQVTLFFSEEIEPRFSAFDLYDARGQLVSKIPILTEEGGLRVVLALPALAHGAYTISWRVLSAIDGHTTTGVYPFGVGPGDEFPLPQPDAYKSGPDLLAALVRWGHSLALVFFAGVLVFQRIFRTRFAALRGLWGLAVLMALGELVLYAHSLGEVSARTLWGTRVGVVLSAQIAVLAVAGLTLAREGLWGWLGVALSLSALGMGAVSSHSAALQDPVALGVDMAHRLAGGIWVGGLLALGLLLRRHDESTPWNLVLPRFSLLALLSVAVLVGSGVSLAVAHLGTLAALWETSWGRWLMVKLSLLLVIIAMAALNFRQVRRDFRGDYGQTDLAPLRRRVWGELIAGVLAVGAAGALALSAPPNAAMTVLTHESDGLRVVLIISSLRVGPAHFAVQLRQAHTNSPVPQVQRVTLEFRYGGSPELGTIAAIAEPTSTGDFALHGLYLSVEGRWQITVRVRLSDRAEDVTAVFAVEARR